jgi:cation transport ATPase
MMHRLTHILSTYRQFVLAFTLELIGIARFLFFPKLEWLPHRGWIETILALLILCIIAYFFVRAFTIMKTRNREPIFFILLTIVAVGLIANVILFFARSYCVMGLLDQGKLTTDTGRASTSH